MTDPKYEDWFHEAISTGKVSAAHDQQFQLCWQASRRAALEECWEAVHSERLEDPTETHGDMAYERAVADCENAICALSGATET